MKPQQSINEMKKSGNYDGLASIGDAVDRYEKARFAEPELITTPSNWTDRLTYALGMFMGAIAIFCLISVLYVGCGSNL